MQDEKQSEKRLTVRVVAGCLVVKDGKFLFVRENKKKERTVNGKRQLAQGLWGLPSGHAVEGETFEQASIRETMEETGLDVELSGKVGVFHEHELAPVVHIFRAKVLGGELKPRDDSIGEAKWLSLSEVKDLSVQGLLRGEFVMESVLSVG